MSSYQIAIAIDRADRDLKNQIGKRVGGAGTGEHNSLAQYIGNDLSRQITSDGDTHFAEGAFMSNERVTSLVYADADGVPLHSSIPGTVYDMALFRLRHRP